MTCTNWRTRGHKSCSPPSEFVAAQICTRDSLMQEANNVHSVRRDWNVDSGTHGHCRRFGADCLFALWYSELPQAVEDVRTLPNQQLDEPHLVRLPIALERISFWCPGLDKPTALLTAALLLSLFSLGGGRFVYALLRRRGKDDPCIGGMILQTFARLFPTEPAVAGLALVRTTYTNPIRTTKFGSVYSAIEKPVIVPLLYLTIFLSPLVWLMNVLSYLNGSAHRSTERQSFSGEETIGQLDFTARFVLVQSPAVLAKGMLGMIEFDESTNVRTIPFPTVIVAAEKDPVTLPSASHLLTESIPTAYCVPIPLGRHQAQWR
jgi:hypothetical protein